MAKLDKGESPFSVRNCPFNIAHVDKGVADDRRLYHTSVVSLCFDEGLVRLQCRKHDDPIRIETESEHACRTSYMNT